MGLLPFEEAGLFIFLGVQPSPPNRQYLDMEVDWDRSVVEIGPRLMRYFSASEYVGFVTHKGALFLSFSPFKGGKILGVARGNEATLQLDEARTVSLTSQTPFLPDGLRANVYGFFLPERKTHKWTSVRSVGMSKEADFLKRIAEN